jgi:hypothetical protein
MPPIQGKKVSKGMKIVKAPKASKILKKWQGLKGMKKVTKARKGLRPPWTYKGTKILLPRLKKTLWQGQIFMVLKFFKETLHNFFKKQNDVHNTCLAWCRVQFQHQKGYLTRKNSTIHIHIFHSVHTSTDDLR